ncbi:hypothetical protein B9479_005775 [Cryptococcus floricola]|uniref:F-box domain-containing protein n=1 Tax=Cryptococcus floricola TaxID=2591691 RepID=A0A5D3ATN7_9TREE|nr:hypothetical protein B9479_005775 [Cryptococcus floricola]
MSSATLNTDILHHTLALLPTSSLATSLLASKNFYRLCSPLLWREVELDLSKEGESHPLVKALVAGSRSDVQGDGWDTSPAPYVRHLTLLAHTDSSPCSHIHPPPSSSEPHTNPLPNLITLHLTIHPSSPVGWSFCAPSDRERYPVYPATLPCPLLEILRPRRLVISHVRGLVSPTPFRKGCGVWEDVREVVVRLRVGGGMWSVNGNNCFWEMLGEKVERIVVVVDDLKGRALPFEGEKIVKDIRERVAPLALKRGISILVVNLPVSPENLEMAGSRDGHAKGDVGDVMVEGEGEKGEIKFETMEGWLKTGQWVGVFSQQEVKVLDYYSKPSFHQ